jgi:hypothetical protein
VAVEMFLINEWNDSNNVKFVLKNTWKTKNAKMQIVKQWRYFTAWTPLFHVKTLQHYSEALIVIEKRSMSKVFKKNLSLLFMKLNFEKHLSYLMMPISSMAIDNSMNFNHSYKQHERNQLLAKLHQSLMEGLW